MKYLIKIKTKSPSKQRLLWGLYQGVVTARVHSMDPGGNTVTRDKALRTAVLSGSARGHRMVDPGMNRTPYIPQIKTPRAVSPLGRTRGIPLIKTSTPRGPPGPLPGTPRYNP